MFGKEYNLNKITLSLKKFGLNPQEWRADVKNGEKVMFHHKRDPSFCLLALCCGQKMSVQTLSVWSL